MTVIRKDSGFVQLEIDETNESLTTYGLFHDQ